MKTKKEKESTRYQSRTPPASDKKMVVRYSIILTDSPYFEISKLP